uniref:SCP domain-containing protein n=1 Tax=Mesocestoides corti TaxID=53468 RepID=A0A5K3EFM5_MESCO
MIRVICIFILFSNVLAEAPSEQEKKDIMELHAELREQVDPPASNMLMLSYSTELEKLAGPLAATCMPGSADAETQPEYKGLGHVSIPGEPNKHSFFSVLSQIKEEKSSYDYNTNSCNRFCYDYKQASVDLIVFVQNTLMILEKFVHAS